MFLLTLTIISKPAVYYRFRVPNEVTDKPAILRGQDAVPNLLRTLYYKRTFT